MAARAASLTSAGAGKSGKPWARLTALWCMARRVISRMTDSVNWPALTESDLRAACAMVAADELASRGGVIGSVYRCHCPEDRKTGEGHGLGMTNAADAGDAASVRL